MNYDYYLLPDQNDAVQKHPSKRCFSIVRLSSFVEGVTGIIDETD